MIALTLSSELSCIETARPGRANQLSVYVDRWCEIEADAASVFARAPASASGPATLTPTPAPPTTTAAAATAASTTASGGETTSKVSGVVVSSVGVGAAGSLDCAAVAERCETLLSQVGVLAGALSLPNATTANEGIGRRVVRQLSFALTSFKQAMGFCARGFSILARDCAEVGSLINQAVSGGGIQPADWTLVRRVGLDLVALVPYTIIMIIPLSPPGHVFAFSLLNRCFPNAVPSPFTAERQDIYEIYKSIATEAAAQTAAASSSTAAKTTTKATPTVGSGKRLLSAATSAAAATKTAALAVGRGARKLGSLAQAARRSMASDGDGPSDMPANAAGA